MDNQSQPDRVDKSSLEGAILQFFVQQSGKSPLFPYLHNDMARFEPGRSSVYYSGPYWGPEEVAAAMGSLMGGQWLSAGESVRSFEIGFARKIHQRQALMVNSGSSANLVLVTAAKKHFGWVDGDEVAVSVVGFPTTPAPLVQNGLVPLWIDIEMDSLNFDLDRLEASLTDRTRAIFLSPALGNPPDMDRLVELCTSRGLVLLLDDCDSLGSKWKGLYLNEYAHASSNSFYSSHHLCTGEGGMVVSNDADFMKVARSLAWWGRDCTCVGKANLLPDGSCGNRFDHWLPGRDECIDHRYVFSQVGYNLKPLDLQGAIGLVQLGKFDEIHAKRRAAKARIGAAFERLLPVKIPSEHEHAETSWFGVPVSCPSQAFKEALVAHLEASRIQTRSYFAGNILMHPGYTHLGDWRRYPLATEVLDRVFFVGAAPHYTEAVFQYIEQVLAAFKAP